MGSSLPALIPLTRRASRDPIARSTFGDCAVKVATSMSAPTSKDGPTFARKLQTVSASAEALRQIIEQQNYDGWRSDLAG